MSLFYQTTEWCSALSIDERHVTFKVKANN